MKNIHVLPTPNSSRIYLIKSNNKLGITSNNPEFTENFGSGTQNQHICITSNEEIKEGDFWLYICPINGLDYGDNGNPIVKNNLPNSWFEKLHDKNNYKKIILTTDQDLIKDGVQAIDDEFLEWFVKNPSCEYVDIQPDKVYNKNRDSISYYKIIIPKEEHKQECKGSFKDCFNSLDKCVCDIMKQETLEEYIERETKGLIEPNLKAAAKAFIRYGAKWQQERSYSEVEDFINWIDKEGIPAKDGKWIKYFDGKDNYLTTEELFKIFENK